MSFGVGSPFGLDQELTTCFARADGSSTSDKVVKLSSRIQWVRRALWGKEEERRQERRDRRQKKQNRSASFDRSVPYYSQVSLCNRYTVLQSVQITGSDKV